MLYEIYTENFALISKLRLTLGGGMNALTGETGAGKSLLIDAVSLLIGARGSDTFIRSGCDKCLIEGVFWPPYPQSAVDFLHNQYYSQPRISKRWQERSTDQWPCC